MDLLDTYVLRARLFPAVLATAPALVFALVNVSASYDDLGLPQILISATFAMLFFAMSDLARRLGLRTEKKLFAETGGRPFPTVLRHRDNTISAKSKARYHDFLAKCVNEQAPSRTVEKNDSARADLFYISCGNWLRENTRDQAKFHLLFSENVIYGFRRNLFGLKWIGLGLNLCTVILTIWMLASSEGQDFVGYGLVLIASALHATFFLFGVTRRSVLDASLQYGRQLVLSCESLMN